MYYGIELEQFQGGYFTYQNQLYYFCYIADVKGFLDIYHYYRYVMHVCGCEGYSIVKNHNQDIVSSQHILFIYHQTKFSFPYYLDVILQPTTFQKIKIIDIKEQWIQKIDCMRASVKDYAYSFKHDQDMISLIYYYCGIGENAINILNEILMIDESASVSLSLSLIHPVNNYIYEILNPINYTFSTRARQIVCLLRSHLLTYENVQELLESQYYDVYEIIYLFARVLYPSSFFDQVLGKQMSDQQIQEYYFHMEEEREMYQKMMKILSFYVTLPKISWISEQNVI